ncbi:Co-chaperone [Entomophthora muscae]|uniref:Co-chaperone n=2 Tax=Entomophthora muscae TaxID=34485 RepID=A0ACC2SCT9_9FUNG|nr:Co-chaperone [Entomophthora muscae]
MVLKLCWKGTSADGTEAEGRITIPEVAHDTDPSDYVFEITVDSDSRAKDPIRQVVRTFLSAEIKQVFASFTKDLIDSHSKDVYIDPSQLGTPSHSATSSAISQPEPPKKTGSSASAPKVSESPSASINTCTLKDTIEFVASGMDVFQALTDPTLVSIWTRSPATISKDIDSNFSLFGGNIQGTVKELVPGKKIVQKWRTNNWPAGHYSTVTILLEEQTGSVNLILEQDGVPVGELDITRRNWAQFYWNSIKSTFGYGATL